MLNRLEADAHFIRDNFTWRGQVGIGGQKRAAITADATTGALRDARWVGVSTLVAHKFIPRWELVGRLDPLKNDKNGGGLLGYGVADSCNGLGPAANLACDPARRGQCRRLRQGRQPGCAGRGFE